MAAAGVHVRSEDHFLCPICLDVFNDPVSTPCGHNFCNKCITRHWDTNVMFNCPMCKEVFDTKPQLKINRLIAEMVDQFKREPQQKKKTTEREIQEMIEKRLKVIEEIKRSIKMSRTDADQQIAEGVEVFMALKESVDRGLDQFIKEITDKHTTAEKEAEDVITEMEDEISELVKRSTEVDQLSFSEDHLDLLQSFSSLKATQPTKNWTEVRVRPPYYEGTVMRAVERLEKTVSEHVKKLKKQELNRVQQFEVDLTLDPDTAHPKLLLSGDGKQVYCGSIKKNHPENPERFSHHPCVLGYQSFSSGRFYFEVQVKGKPDWTLGVVRESIDRKGVSMQSGFWMIGMRNGQCFACDGPSNSLSISSLPGKIGVFVDYDGGLVSFYDVDSADAIYSFTGCCFTDKLYPLLSPWFNNGLKNSAPLIICPVNQTA